MTLFHGRPVLAVLQFLIVFSLYHSALACKYTVRDIGFTDLEAGNYYLYLYIDNQTDDEIRVAFERLTYASFLDANVRSEIIHTQRQADHPALDYLRRQKDVTLPAVILADPEGNTLRLPFTFTRNNLNQSLWRLIERVISSPLREMLIKQTTETYAAVLLIESKNAAENQRAGQEISAAISEITQALTLMAKPVDNPPRQLVLTADKFPEEEVLRWSLGADLNRTEEAQVAILFGRGRRLGPLLNGKSVSKENIFSLLAIIGADCECGLERSLMLGKMLPLRWEKELQAALREQLGFDVENPIIKSEIGLILSLSPDRQSGQNATSPLSAYREGIISFPPHLAVPTVSSDPFRQAGSSSSERGANPVLRIGLYTGGGLLLLVLTIAGFVFIRSRRH